VLDFEGPSGSSPALKETYRCHDCPLGEPRRYILFSQSEIGRLAAARPAVAQMLLRDDRIEVHVNEAVANGMPPAGRVYALDRTLRVFEADLAENYVAVHNDLRIRGLLDHPLQRRHVSLFDGAFLGRKPLHPTDPV
jgi:hypothetical protein